MISREHHADIIPMPPQPLGRVLALESLEPAHDLPVGRAIEQGALVPFLDVIAAFAVDAAGANINAKNKKGQTPLAVANLTMQNEAAALLRSKGGIE